MYQVVNKEKKKSKDVKIVQRRKEDTVRQQKEYKVTYNPLVLQDRNKMTQENRQSVMQRVPCHHEKDSEEINLSDEVTRKLDTVCAVIGGATLFSTFIGAINIIIDEKPGTNPASTRVAGTMINIYMRKWVAEKNSEGFILGMLAHELGVHTLTDGENEDLHDQEAQGINHDEYDFNLVPGKSYRLTPVDYQNNPDGRQQDHINVAKITKIAEAGINRAKAYLELIIKMGNEMIVPQANIPQTNAAVQINEAIKPKLRELMETYLFDVGRIILDDDKNRTLKVMFNTGNIAEIMNYIQAWICNGANQNNLQVRPINNWFAQVGYEQQDGMSIATMLSGRLAGWLFG